jgi:hypothetical protein
LPGGVKLENAARRLLSASIRKFALTTTGSPSPTPSSTCTYALDAKLDRPRLEATLAGLNQHPFTGTAPDNRGRRHSEHPFRARLGGNLDTAVQRGLEQGAGIRQLDANLSGARLRVQRGIDEGDATLEGTVGKGIDVNRRALPGTHQTEVLFEHICDQPEGGEVGNPEQRVAGHETHPVDDHLLHHHARGR